MNRSVDATAALQFRIGRVDDRLTCFRGDISNNDIQAGTGGRHNQSIVGLKVVVTARSRVAATVLVVPVLIKAHHGGLRRDTALFEPGSLDGPNKVFSSIEIGCLKHHLVIGDVEMAVEQRDTEAIETIVLRQYGPYVFQTCGIAVIDWPDIGDVVKLAPLHRLEND
jgi:hypothetical protein